MLRPQRHAVRESRNEKTDDSSLHQPDGRKPVKILDITATLTYQPDGGYAPTVVQVADGRASTTEFTLDTHGFQLVQDLVDIAQLATEYNDGGSGLHDVIHQGVYPQVGLSLCRRLGAARVLPFSHVVRRCPSLEALSGAKTQPPLGEVHNDYTKQSGRAKAARVLSKYLNPPDVECVMQQRFAIIHVWTPLSTVTRDPLGMIEFPSVMPSDVQVRRCTFADHILESYNVSFSPTHRWVYFSSMEQNESILLKTFESDPYAAQMAPHSAFALPDQDAQPGRESFEIRCLVLYEALPHNLLTQLDEQRAAVINGHGRRHKAKGPSKQMPVESVVLPSNPDEWHIY